MGTFRDMSKTNYTVNRLATNEDVNTGSLQRIADATELMASNYLRLQADLNMYKKWHKESQEGEAKMVRRISALQGVITRLKNKTK